MSYNLHEFLQASVESFVVTASPSPSRFVLKFSARDAEDGREEKRILDLLKDNDCKNILFYVDHQFTVDGYYFVFPYVSQVAFPRTFPRIWEFIAKLVNAVYCCHFHNILHCDIKPDNFLIAEKDVFLTDFGSAQITRRDDDSLTYGTTEYWSPEVCQELPTSHELPRDVWALGVTIMELVYLQYPFSTEPDPNYIGGRVDRARADALLTSIEKFLGNVTQGNFFPSPFTVFLPLRLFHSLSGLGRVRVELKLMPC